MQSSKPLAIEFDGLRKERRAHSAAAKRALDLVLCLLAMPLALPLIAICWSLARLDGGPGLFAHRRIGRHHKTFYCFKIRTMNTDAQQRLDDLLRCSQAARNEWDATQKLANDPRITAVGRVLRRTSLDELPQIFNVLRGEMSLVGPRPVVPDELDRYGPYSSLYLSVRPGLTGLWQVSGRNDISYSERVLMDVDYVMNISILRDLKLILRTALEVFRRGGF